MLYDLIIVGGGPAGIAAGVYAARKKINTLLVAPDLGGQSKISPEVSNWIGTPQTTGPELARQLESHLRQYEGDSLVIKNGQRVKSITKNKTEFEVTTENNELYRSRAVLFTAGSSRRKLDVPGADKFDQKGLTYCASCDGPVFSGKDVAVIGGGNAGFETAAELLAYCRSVTLLHNEANFKAEPITVDSVLNKSHMTAIPNASVSEVTGDNFVSGLKYLDQTSGQTKHLNVQGIFVEIGIIPNTEPLKELVDLTDHNSIKIDPWSQRTSQEGIWAAGDCTNGLYQQNNIAAGDAIKALEDIFLYLQKTTSESESK